MEAETKTLEGIIPLGATVTSKKTGFPTVGYLLGHCHPQVWMAFQGVKDVTRYTKWNELYPGWHAKILYMVLYKEPQRPMTLEEFKFSCKTELPDLSETEMEEKYEEMPKYPWAMFPMDDVEEF